VRALHARVPEAPFQFARGFLMLAEIVAIGDGAQMFEVDSRPDRMEVLAAVMLVHDYDAGMIFEAELFFHDIGGFDGLFARQRIRRLGLILP